MKLKQHDQSCLEFIAAICSGRRGPTATAAGINVRGAAKGPDRDLGLVAAAERKPLVESVADNSRLCFRCFDCGRCCAGGGNS